MRPDYRYLQCCKCDVITRILVSETNFGRKVEVVCPACGAKNQTTVLNKMSVEDLFKTLVKATAEAFSESQDVKEAVRIINHFGFKIDIGLISTLWPVHDSSSEPEIATIEDEKTDIGFSLEDKRWARKFKIEL